MIQLGDPLSPSVLARYTGGHTVVDGGYETVAKALQEGGLKAAARALGRSTGTIRNRFPDGRPRKTAIPSE